MFLSTEFKGLILKYIYAGKLAKKSVLGISFIAVFALFGCMGNKAIPLNSVPGVSASGIFLHVPADGGQAILTGSVDDNLQRVLVEKHVRNTLGYNNISNRIRFP